MNMFGKLIRIKAAENPNTSTDILEQLAKDENSTIRENAAKDPSANAELIDMLAHDTDRYVQIGAAENRNAKRSTLEYLADLEDPEICESLAQNKNADIDILRKITMFAMKRIEDLCDPYDPDSQILTYAMYNVAKNPNVTDDLLTEFNKNGYSYIIERAMHDCRFAFNS